MIELYFVIFPVLVLAGIVGPYLVSNSIVKSLLKPFARKYKLTYTQPSIFNRPRVDGRIEGNTIEINSFYNNALSRNRKTIIQIKYYPKKVYRVRMDMAKITGLASSLGWSKKGLKQGVQTGDEELDRELEIRGDEMGIVILLNQRVRDSIIKLIKIAYDLSISSREIIIQVKLSDLDSGILIDLVDEIVKLNNYLSVDDDFIELIKQNILKDAYPLVRKRNIQALVKGISNKKTVDQILLLALKDKDWRVSLCAAQYLGEQALEHLHSLFLNTPPKGIIEVVKTLAKLAKQQSITPLKKLYSTTTSVEMQVEILKAFRNIGDTELNSFLLSQLKAVDSELRLQAIQALETCGTMAAVKELYKISKQLISMPGIKTAAKTAISRIQIRLARGKEGELSLIQKQAGRGELSITPEGEGGALSLDEEQGDRD